jgi:N-acetylglucosaminyldiphosphoundecaprenol N-acetyl-beta-D-mannosaminyltransferase
VQRAYASLARHTLGPLSFDSAARDDLVAFINAHAESGHGGLCIGYINPHVYNLAQEQPVVSRFLNQCDLVCIDGLGTSLAVKAAHGWFSRTPVHRVVALNLFDDLVKRFHGPGDALLIGVDIDDVQLSASRINRVAVSLHVIDVMDGFRCEAEYRRFLSSHPSVPWILIGAGTPKSESIALLARELCPQAIVFPIGAGTIKVYAGTKRRAPAWVSHHGLEWAHRMLFEPHTRHRYTVGGWQFLRNLLPSLLNRPSRRSAP